jgi:serine/threonine protein kinase
MDEGVNARQVQASVPTLSPTQTLEDVQYLFESIPALSYKAPEVTNRLLKRSKVVAEEKDLYRPGILWKPWVAGDIWSLGVIASLLLYGVHVWEPLSHGEEAASGGGDTGGIAPAKTKWDTGASTTWIVRKEGRWGSWMYSFPHERTCCLLNTTCNGNASAASVPKPKQNPAMSLGFAPNKTSSGISNSKTSSSTNGTTSGLAFDEIAFALSQLHQQTEKRPHRCKNGDAKNFTSSITEAASDFLKTCLQVNPTKRPSAEALLVHRLVPPPPPSRMSQRPQPQSRGQGYRPGYLEVPPSVQAGNTQPPTRNLSGPPSSIPRTDSKILIKRNSELVRENINMKRALREYGMKMEHAQLDDETKVLGFSPASSTSSRPGSRSQAAGRTGSARPGSRKRRDRNGIESSALDLMLLKTLEEFAEAQNADSHALQDSHENERSVQEHRLQRKIYKRILQMKKMEGEWAEEDLDVVADDDNEDAVEETSLEFEGGGDAVESPISSPIPEPETEGTEENAEGISKGRDGASLWRSLRSTWKAVHAFKQAVKEELKQESVLELPMPPQTGGGLLGPPAPPGSNVDSLDIYGGKPPPPFLPPSKDIYGGKPPPSQPPPGILKTNLDKPPPREPPPAVPSALGVVRKLEFDAENVTANSAPTQEASGTSNAWAVPDMLTTPAIWEHVCQHLCRIVALKRSVDVLVEAITSSVWTAPSPSVLRGQLSLFLQANATFCFEKQGTDNLALARRRGMLDVVKEGSLEAHFKTCKSNEAEIDTLMSECSILFHDLLESKSNPRDQSQTAETPTKSPPRKPRESGDVSNKAVKQQQTDTILLGWLHLARVSRKQRIGSADSVSPSIATESSAVGDGSSELEDADDEGIVDSLHCSSNNNNEGWWWKTHVNLFEDPMRARLYADVKLWKRTKLEKLTRIFHIICGVLEIQTVLRKTHSCLEEKTRQSLETTTRHLERLQHRKRKTGSGSGRSHVARENVIQNVAHDRKCLQKSLESILQSEDAYKSKERTFALHLQRAIGQILDANALALAEFQYKEMVEELLALNQRAEDRLDSESYYDGAAANWTEEEAYAYEAQALWAEYREEYCGSPTYGSSAVENAYAHTSEQNEYGHYRVDHSQQQWDRPYDPVVENNDEKVLEDGIENAGNNDGFENELNYDDEHAWTEGQTDAYNTNLPVDDAAGSFQGELVVDEQFSWTTPIGEIEEDAGSGTGEAQNVADDFWHHEWADDAIDIIDSNGDHQTRGHNETHETQPPYEDWTDPAGITDGDDDVHAYSANLDSTQSYAEDIDTDFGLGDSLSVVEPSLVNESLATESLDSPSLVQNRSTGMVVPPFTPPTNELNEGGQLVVKALADYDAQDASELNLNENESVTVLLKDASGWWQGRDEMGNVGWFPSNFVHAAYDLWTIKESPRLPDDWTPRSSEGLCE